MAIITAIKSLDSDGVLHSMARLPRRVGGRQIYAQQTTHCDWPLFTSLSTFTNSVCRPKRDAIKVSKMLATLTDSRSISKGLIDIYKSWRPVSVALARFLASSRSDVECRRPEVSLYETRQDRLIGVSRHDKSCPADRSP